MTPAQEASRAAFEAPTDLHAAIMNLPCKFEAAWQMPAPSDWIEGYVNGHRDTRHAAAELALAATAARSAEVEELRALLKECRKFFATCPDYDGADTNNLDTRCMDALKEQS